MPDISVYFILTIIGVPIFFIWRWLLRRLAVVEKIRKVFVWSATIITTPLIYCGFIWLMFCYYPEHNFSKEEWQIDKEKRYEFSENIINSKMLIGKSKEEVKQILGDEGNSNTSDNWSYYIGHIPEVGNIDPNSLCITFKDKKVAKVIQH